MTRSQAEIPGFERQVENEHVEAAAASYCQIRDERSALSKKEKKAQLELEATMRAHGYTRYEYPDNNGELLVARIVEGATKAVVEKTGEAEVEIGEGVDSGEGLMADAARAQAASNVEENAEGDVVVPETSAPKAKRKRKAKPE